MAEYNPEDIEKMERFFGLIGNINEALSTEEQEKKKLEEQAKKAREKWDIFFKQLGNTVSQLGKAAVSPQEGFSKFNSSINSAGAMVADVASNFGVLGKAAGGVIKLFTSLATASLEQQDRLVKSFNTLSDLGSVTKGGIEALGDQLRQMGYTSLEAEKFEKILGANASQLVLFKGGMIEGRAKLAEVIEEFTKYGNKFEFQLNNLGISTDVFREEIADYISMQTRLGLSQSKNTAQLRDESFKYMVVMKELQELTGLTRDEQRKLRDKQMQDARFAVHLSEMNRQEALNLQNYMVLFEKQFGPELAAGLKDRIVNAGAVTTDAAAASYQAYAGAFDDAIKAQRKGTQEYMSGLQNQGKGVMGLVRALRGAFNNQEGVLKDLGITNESVIGSLSVLDVNSEKYAETLKVIQELQKSNGKGIQQTTETNQSSRATAIAFDKALQTVGTTFVTVMNYVQKALFRFGKFLAYTIEKLAPIIGIDVKAGDLLQFFREAEDVANDLAAARQTETSAVQKLIRAEKNIEDIRNEGIASAYKKQSALVKKLDSEFTAMQTDGNVPTSAEIERMAAAQEKLNLLEKLKNAGLEQQTKIFEDYLGKSKESLKLEQEKIKKLEEELNLKRLGENIAGGQAGKLDSELSAVSQQTDKTLGKLLDFIGKAEGAGYSTVFGGKTNENLTNMTLSEILVYQKELFKQNKVSSAIGKYQFIRPTLEGLINTLGLKGTEKFTPELQDQLAKELIRQRKDQSIDKATGKFSYEKFLDQLSMEWASLPLATGRSYYHGDKAGNRARVSREELRKNVPENVDIPKPLKNPKTVNVPEGSSGGLFSGSDTGYPILLHGKNESVWPEKDLKKLLDEVQKTSLAQYKEELMSEMTNKSTTSTVMPTVSTNNDTAMIDAFANFSRKLDDVISKLDQSNSIQTDLLTYTRA